MLLQATGMKAGEAYEKAKEMGSEAMDKAKSAVSIQKNNKDGKKYKSTIRVVTTQ